MNKPDNDSPSKLQLETLKKLGHPNPQSLTPGMASREIYWRGKVKDLESAKSQLEKILPILQRVLEIIDKVNQPEAIAIQSPLERAKTSPAANISQLIDADEVAAILAVSKSSVYKLTKREKNPIPRIDLGLKLCRYEREKVIRWRDNGGLSQS